MNCELGRLTAYRDGALPSEEMAEVERHLAHCSSCRQQLVLLEGQREEVVRHLHALDPGPGQEPDPSHAWARFQAQVLQGADTAPSSRPSEGVGIFLKRRWNMARTRLAANRRWRPAAAAVAAMVVLAILFSLAPVRQAGAEFLGIFRVRKFAVIPLDATQTERLEQIAEMVERTLTPTYLRQPGEPRAVSSAAEASALAGFHVRVPTALAEGATLQEFTVRTGPAIRLEVPRETAQTLLEALGLGDVPLPPADPLVAEGDVPVMVYQVYGVGTGRLELVQFPSPTATLPEGMDPRVLGEVLLRALGLPEKEAQHLAQSIDWTSTLVIPLPTEVAQFREVEVDGVTGLWIEETPTRASGGYRPVTVLWQRDDVVYGLVGYRIAGSLVLQAAESLQ